MDSNISELVKLGHERADELKAACGAVDVRSVAQLISDLASQLEVQYVRAEESRREFSSADITMQNLEAQLKQSKIDADCYKKGMEASNARLVQLAAENAKLADCANFYRLGFKPAKGAFGIEYRPTEQLLDDCGNTALEAIKTTATDSFLDEVRAQVWIEGNQPAEFGRYWVRYETDVGPQYCSAKWMEHNFCAGSDTNIHKIWLADHSRSINSLRGVTHYTKLPDSLEGAAQ
ncbi:TPA: hypothetical protein ACHFNM_002662 [Enterobacter hormaechei]|uniref:hypothetical protein n=1 Tax=Enterobacter hormaechei TaxID=158836 RepID=UPI0012582040|nr:hypothetical protein [Enterobacter hormaechei]VAF45906.1 Uncharacterised protein [Enterobacter hormaechei]